MDSKNINTKAIAHSSNEASFKEQLKKAKEEAESANIALRTERDLFQRYLSLVEAIIVTLDPNGIITMLNRKGCELLGYKKEDILGVNWFKKCLPQPQGWEDVYPVFKDIMDGNISAAEYFENEICTTDGQKRLIAWHNNYFRDENDQIIGTISAGEDITERKQAEKERDNLIKQLQTAISEIKTLRGIVPLCSFCKKIRDDKGYWEQVDIYIQKHSEADISHSLCPECMKKHYPEEYRAIYPKKI